MQTDPKNTAYVVVSGATKRSPREGDEEDLVAATPGAAPILTDGEREQMRQSAFSNLEKTIADRERLIHADERISSLVDASSRDWDDPYARNQRLRRHFRVGRKQREVEAAATEEVRERMGLGIELLPESEEDKRRAALVEFIPSGDSLSDALAKPLFDNGSGSGSGSDTNKSRDAPPVKGVTKAERAAAKRKDHFVTAVMGNTRMVRDPFLNTGWDGNGKGPARLPGVKGKKDATDRGQSVLTNTSTSREATPTAPTVAAAATAPAGMALVDYDSD